MCSISQCEVGPFAFVARALNSVLAVAGSKHMQLQLQLPQQRWSGKILMVVLHKLPRYTTTGQVSMAKAS